MGNGLILILADGTWEDDDRLNRLSQSSDWTIAADGGFEKGIARGIRVDEVVGDLDSLSRRSREGLAGSPVTVHVHPRSKEKTDLELAIELALARKPERIVVFGGLGGRIDHTLANAFLLLKEIPAGVPIELVSGRETLLPLAGTYEIRSGRIGDSVSLIPITEEAVVRTEGLAYPLDREGLSRGSSRGISNEIASLPARIIVEDGILLLVHRRGG